MSLWGTKNAGVVGSKSSPYVVEKFISRLKEMGIFDEVVQLIRPRGVSIEDLISRDRHKNVSAARHEIMYWIRTKLKWSYPEIGRLFGRDHTTVLDACRKVHKENPTFGEIVPDPYDSSSWIIR